MKNIFYVIPLMLYVYGENIKMFKVQEENDSGDGPNVQPSDLLPLTEGLLDFSVCFRYFTDRVVDEGKIFLMNFDLNNQTAHFMSTYLLWTLDGSKVQLFQRFCANEYCFVMKVDLKVLQRIRRTGKIGLYGSGL